LGSGGGGSSFILTKDASIPQGNIIRHTCRYEYIEEKQYSFINDNRFLFTDIEHANGIWRGR
jgi:hypothetical protein